LTGERGMSEPGPAGTRAAAVILADGWAGQMSDEPRAFIRVFGRTLLGLCAETVDACPGIQAFVVVAPAGMEDRITEACRAWEKFLVVVPGGSTRRESLAAGIAALPPGVEAVLCHDVARPLASPELFAAVLRALDEADAVLPLVPVGDTVKRVGDGMVRATISRDDLGVLQTPQGYRRDALVSALRAENGKRQGPANEGALLAGAGLRVVTIPGDPANLEVRTPGDVRLVEALLAARLSRSDGR
jgi:2-C-methyl-D-erythritol 4-phosphate cytidylyltransferase